MKRPHRHLALLLLFALAGCDQIGATMGLAARMVPRTIDPAYRGLAGQQVVVMAWADERVALDNQDLKGEVAAAVQDQLINVQRDDHPDALAAMTFPYSTTTVEKYQDDHPEWENMSAEAVAAKLVSSRLIYIEITDFQTRGPASLELFRGSMTAHVRVVEVKSDRQGNAIASKVAYDGGDISVVFPKDAPRDGLPNRRESQIVEGTIKDFAEDLAKRFYKHTEDRN